MKDASSSILEQISVDLIDRNNDNPRLVFRPGELDELLESIRQYGVQVPISLYKEGRRYVLIDGERRWRCSLKLNKKTIPALVQDKPDPLNNLLLMFNIHALREQWDLLTIAMKLPRVIELLTKEISHEPSERELSEHTGLNRSVIRRSRLLLELPENYRQDILLELNKPKSQQKITEDLFIELERALKTVERSLPSLVENKDRVRRHLIAKYKSGVIPSKVHLRKVAKIARAEKVGASRSKASSELKKLFEDKEYTIDQAYDASVADAYSERSALTLVTSATNSLKALGPEDIDRNLRSGLIVLKKEISRLLEER
jgi:ParB/RepB/Spo0J family partition protein